MNKYESAKSLKLTKARLPKTCERCGAAIQKGDEYFRESLGPMAKPPGLHLSSFCMACGSAGSYAAYQHARFGVDSKVDRLYLLAQKIAERTPGFFEAKGPGVGDQASLKFMDNLRRAATGLFGENFSEKKVSAKVSFSLDFYLSDEATAVEVALGLHNPSSEYERDIFNCLLAQDAGYQVQRLLLIAKPGALSRQGAPGPQAIADFVKKTFGLRVEIRELAPPLHGNPP